MARDWESIFTTWSNGPSQSETDRVENAENQIRKAISNSNKLNRRDIKVFTQGSYRNRVNVRQNSDIDIGVLCYDTFFPDYADDNIKAQLFSRQNDATYTYRQFKDEIEEALVTYFGRTSVKRSNKAFDISGNTYRVEADVSAFFEHRRYTSVSNYFSGVQMLPDNAQPPSIINWPEQHYANGVGKNTRTSRRFKRVVRVLKNLANEMVENKIPAAAGIPSFLIECLVWNVPDANFEYSNFYPMVRSVLASLFNDTINDQDSKEWGEISELKYLFRPTQPWTRQKAHEFLGAAWDYVGYK